jgi:SAM-dependent methyltransferase
VELAQPGTHVYKMTMTTDHSLVHLLNTAFLLCAFFASFNRHVWQLDKPLCERLIGIMHTMDAPYYVRYRFIGQFLDRSTFPEMQAALTARPSKHYESVVFHEGTTADHRRDMIRELLDFKRPILEIGCGEGFYTVPFAQRVRPLPLVAIDVDETVLAQTRHRCAAKNLTNVSFHASLDAFLTAGGEAGAIAPTVYDCIMTEVLEHLYQEDSEKLMKQVMEHVAFRSFIITTPNADFNVFYLLGPDEMRHDDHKFELGTAEFQAWAGELLKPFSDKFTWEFVPVGDIVDGIACSHGLIIKARS